MSQNERQAVSYSVSQNFLTSHRLISRLVRIAGITKSDTVLEIGAGKGHITKVLSENCEQVIAYEVDRPLYERLQPQIGSNVKLYCGDFLKCRLPVGAYKVFANIPFSITTAILRKLTSAVPAPRDMWLIMEKGAAKRFCGLPKDNLNSLLLKPYFDGKIVYHFKREDFHPAPKTDVVMLWLHSKDMADIPLSQRNDYTSFLRHSFRFGLLGPKALLTHKQIAAALRMEGLPPLKPSDDVLYIQWLCLFRCWLRYGKRK